MVWRDEMMPHYYSEEQQGIFKLKEFEDMILGNRLKFITGSGIFSIGKIDTGTRLLIENAMITENTDILDIGCGYGIVGIAVKKAHQGCNIFMSDINKRAVSLADKNANLNKADVTIRQGSLYEPWQGMKFDTILSNPPYSAGRKICCYIIENALGHLRQKGTLQLVARHQKGGKFLSEKMESVFGNMDVLAKGSGFRVYVSEMG